MGLRYLKEFKTFSQQIQLLESRGIVFNKISKQDAEEKLSNISYYKLSSYIKTFEVSVDKYNQTDFQEALDLYYFDRKLSRLLFELIERIEISFKTSLAYYIAEYIEKNSTEKVKTFLYLNLKNWVNPCELRDPIKALKKELSFKETIASYTSRNARGCVSYYFNKYTEEHFIPIWMLIEVIDFGVGCNMYEDANTNIKIKVANKFKVSSHKDFGFYLRTLKFVRNRLAHNGVIWNLKLVNQINNKDMVLLDVERGSIFAVIVLIVNLMKNINKAFDYSELESLIENFFNDYPDLLKKFGILNKNLFIVKSVLK